VAVIPPPPAPTSARAREFVASVRLSERVIDHLRRQPRTGPYDIAPAGMSQAGMVEALGASQSAVAKVVRRLVASGVLLESREHVQGAPTRLKVYRLTPLGEALARDIRQRRHGEPLPGRTRLRPPSDAWVVPRPKD
jgi:DNA-binding MarR family transcriptional regulator